MTHIDKIKKVINTLNIEEEIHFSDILVDRVSVDTVRKVLHRLHEYGFITITGRRVFKKEKPFHELLFVYGSLKKGFDNHNLMSQFSKRLGKAKTVKKFGMFEDSFGNYLYLIDIPLNKIEGELYEIHRQELMDRIDEFEGAPEYYQREKVLVKSHRGVQRAFVYIQSQSEQPRNQESLKVWDEDITYKVKQLDSYLNSMISA